MWGVIKKDFPAKLAIVFFILYSFWWFYLQFAQIPQGSQQDLFTVTYGIMAIWGSIWGIYIARKWGGFRSVIGRAIIVFSLGLALQEFGQLAYTYYIYILKVDVPYPSIGDIGYFGSVILYICGVWLLAHASGVGFSLKSYGNKLQAIIIPVIILIVSYFIFLQNYDFNFSKPLTIFLDFGYPLGEAIYVSLALLAYLLSRSLLGGVMKFRVLMILLALIIQYFSDFTFIFQANNNSWVTGGVNDYMYLIAYFSMTLALLQLNVQAIKNTLEKG